MRQINYRENMRKTAEEEESSGGGGGAKNIHKHQPGDNFYRLIVEDEVLSPEKGIIHKFPWHSIRVSADERMFGVCPTFYGRYCRACRINDTTFTEAKEDGNLSKLRKSLWNGHARWAMVAIKRGLEHEGPKILILTPKVGKDAERYFLSSDWPDPGDPMGGWDFNIHRKGTKWNDTEYTFIPSQKTSPLGTPEQIAAWTNVEILPDIQAAFTGADEFKDDPSIFDQFVIDYVTAKGYGHIDAVCEKYGSTGDTPKVAVAVASPGNLDRKWWVNSPSGVVALAESQIRSAMDHKTLTPDVQVMEWPQGKVWAPAHTCGITPTPAMAPIPTPPPSAQAPAPPAPPVSNPPQAPLTPTPTPAPAPAPPATPATSPPPQAPTVPQPPTVGQQLQQTGNVALGPPESVPAGVRPLGGPSRSYLDPTTNKTYTVTPQYGGCFASGYLKDHEVCSRICPFKPLCEEASARVGSETVDVIAPISGDIPF